MKNKIKLVEFYNADISGTYVEVNGERLFYDAENTYNCLQEILEKLGLDADIEYFSETEVRDIVTKKMKLVPVGKRKPKENE